MPPTSPHWLKVLKDDKRAIFTAAAHAQRAVDFLHGLQPATEQARGCVMRRPGTILISPAPGEGRGIRVRLTPGTGSHAGRPRRRSLGRCNTGAPAIRPGSPRV